MIDDDYAYDDGYDPIREDTDHMEQERLRDIERAAAALVASLPTCDARLRDRHGEDTAARCTAPATRAHGRGNLRFCDEHGEGVEEYPRAQPLRDLMKLLEAT